MQNLFDIVASDCKLLLSLYLNRGTLIQFVMYIMSLTFVVSFKGFGENLHGVKINGFNLVVRVLCSPSLASLLPLTQGLPTQPVQGCLLVTFGTRYKGDNDHVQT